MRLRQPFWPWAFSIMVFQIKFLPDIHWAIWSSLPRLLSYFWPHISASVSLLLPTAKLKAWALMVDALSKKLFWISLTWLGYNLTFDIALCNVGSRPKLALKGLCLVGQLKEVAATCRNPMLILVYISKLFFMYAECLCMTSAWASTKMSPLLHLSNWQASPGNLCSTVKLPGTTSSVKSNSRLSFNDHICDPCKQK